MSGLTDGEWHRLAVSVSLERLEVYVDCVLFESLDWVYYGMAVSTAGLLMVGGTVRGHETPFEVSWGLKDVLHMYPVVSGNVRY